MHPSMHLLQRGGLLLVGCNPGAGISPKNIFFATWELFRRHYVALHIEVEHLYIYVSPEKTLTSNWLDLHTSRMISKVGDADGISDHVPKKFPIPMYSNPPKDRQVNLDTKI